MKRALLILTLLLAFAGGADATPSSHTFTVDTTADTIDAAPGDGACADAGGQCSLRAAVMEANALGGTTEIDLAAATYTLSLANPAVGFGVTPSIGANPTTGDIDVTGSVTIVGAGTSSTVLDAANLDREFYVSGSGTLQLSDAIVQNGFQYDCAGGFGIYNAGTLQLTNVALDHSQGNCGSGGAVYNGGTLGATGSTFAHDGTYDGGGLYNGGTATISDSTFSNDSAHTGGGISNGGSLALTNVTLAADATSSGLGGGLYTSAGSAVVKSSTLVDNMASGDNGGGIRADGGTVTLEDTVLAYNGFDGLTTRRNCATGGGTITSAGHNAEDLDTCGLSGTLGDLKGTDPLVDPLADNGGPVQTAALNAASPAIDAGDASCPATDARGVTRSSRDIGAFEYDGAPPGNADIAVSMTTDTTTPAAGGSVVFTITVANGGPVTATGVRIADTLPSNATSSSAGTISQGRCGTISAGALSCDLGSIASGSSASVSVVVGAPATAPTDVTNTATASLDETDPTPLDETASATVTTVPSSLTVTSTGDGSSTCPSASSCTLRGALATVAAGGTVTLPAGTYYLGQELLLTNDVTIAGAGADSTLLTLSQLAPPNRIMQIGTAATTPTVSISGLTIQNGNTDGSGGEENSGVGGGIWNKSGTVTLTHVTVFDNAATVSGGGIDNDGTMTIDQSFVHGNVASGGVLNGGLPLGGGIDTWGPSLTVTNTTIAGNHAAGAGGGLESGGASSLTNVTISGNVGAGALDGGATIVNTLLSANTLQSSRDGNCGTGITSNGYNLSTDSTCAGAFTQSADQNGASTAAAVDAGSDELCAHTIVGPHCDIGADETTAANAAPTASFTTGTSGLALTVDGTGSSDSDGTIAAYAWSFGDGATGSGATAAHTYTAAGTYTVTLTVTDNGGATATTTRSVTVTAPAANRPPAAAFTTATSGLTLSADGSTSTDADGSVVSYAWSFGDGATGAGATATHVYGSAGTYLVTLTVTDDGGATGSASHTVTVSVQAAPPPPSVTPTVVTLAPTPAFNYLPSLPIAGDPVTFSPATPVASSGYTRRWDFGDGATATGGEATHVFAPGAYTVTCSVVDGSGTTVAKATQDVTVGAFPLPAGHTVQGAVTVLRPFGPGEADPAGPADAGLPVALYGTGGELADGVTVAGGLFRLTNVPVQMGPAGTGGHVGGLVGTTSAAYGSAGLSTFTPNVPGGTPSITDLPLTISPHPDALLFEGDVTAAGSAPPAETQITVAVEQIVQGAVTSSATVVSHRLGHYRVELQNAALGSAHFSTGVSYRVTLSEDGRPVDQSGALRYADRAAGNPLPVPPLSAVWPVPKGQGHEVTGTVTVLPPFGPGRADPAKPAPGGLPVVLFGTGGKLADGVTAANGRFRFTNVPVQMAASGIAGHVGGLVGTTSAVYGSAGLDSATSNVPAGTPSVTDLPLTISPHPGALLFEGDVSAAGSAPPAETRVSVTVEEIVQGAVTSSATVSGHGVGHYRVELQNAALSNAHFSTGAGYRVTLSENGQTVDQTDHLLHYSSRLPGNPLTVPPLSAVWPISKGQGHEVTGAVTVLAPFGPGEADPAKPAPAGLPVVLYGIGGKLAGGVTAANGRYRFTNVPVPAGTQGVRHVGVVVGTAADPYGSVGMETFANNVPSATPSITDLSLTISPHPDALVFEGDVGATGGAPPAGTQITVTVEQVVQGTPTSSASVVGHGLGRYRVELRNAAVAGGRFSTDVAYRVTLSENGQTVDQSNLLRYSSRLPGDPLAVPPLTAVAVPTAG